MTSKSGNFSAFAQEVDPVGVTDGRFGFVVSAEVAWSRMRIGAALTMAQARDIRITRPERRYGEIAETSRRWASPYTVPLR